MSQSTLNHANQAGSSYRLAINAALQALASGNSGAAAPTETYAFMAWIDTSNSPTLLVKQRNQSNSAWITVAVIDGSGFRPYYNGAAAGDAMTKTVGTSSGNLAALGAGGKFDAALLPAMTAATEIAAGAAGLVPQPAVGDHVKALFGDGDFHQAMEASKVSPGGLATGSYPHGLSWKPDAVDLVVECASAGGGWAVGDMIPVHNYVQMTNTTSNNSGWDREDGIGWWWDATNIGVAIHGSGWRVRSPTAAGHVSGAGFQMHFTCRRFL